jgi:ATP-dependent DNA ligase
MKTTQKLYKIDSNGNARVWWMEYDNTKYRTHSGIDGGKIVVSGWKYPEAKNVGRANETSVKEQVELEVISQLTKKSAQGKYHASKNTAAKGAKFYECMLASKYDPKKHKNFPYYSQPKLDGIRCLVSKDGMQSRNGKPILSCPHILEALEPFFDKYPDVVLDGELYNHDLKNDFEKIVSLVRKTKPTTHDYIEASKLVQYHIYDCMTDYDFAGRNQMIADIFETFDSKYRKENDPIGRVNTTVVENEHDIETMLGHYLEQGYEGQMLRVPNSLYEGKRSKGLIKHKEFEDDEFEIVSIEEGKGNWAGAAKRVEIRLKDGTTQFSGVRGSFDFLKELLYNANDYIGTDVTVRYQNKTDDNKLRFPVIVTFWKGKRDV